MINMTKGKQSSQEVQNQWTCPQCETANTGKRCRVCGWLLPQPQAPQSDGQGAWGADSPWQCPNCETWNSGTSCSVCGQASPPWATGKQESSDAEIPGQGNGANFQGTYTQELPKWQCTGCETWNTGATCTICGQPRPESDSVRVKSRLKSTWKKICLLASAIAVVAAIAAGIFLGIPYTNYQKACSLLETGRYQQACESFCSMLDYRDSTLLRDEAAFRWAEQLGAKQAYTEAVQVLSYIPEGSPWAPDKQKLSIRFAQALYDQGQYYDSAAILEALPQSKETSLLIQKSKYAAALELKKQKDYAGAYQLLSQLDTVAEVSASMEDAAYKWILQAMDDLDTFQVRDIQDTITMNKSLAEKVYKQLYTRDLYDYSGERFSYSTLDLEIRKMLLEMIPHGTVQDQDKFAQLLDAIDLTFPLAVVQNEKDLLKELWYMPVVENLVRNDLCIDEWLLGKWVSSNKRYTFELTDEGDYYHTWYTFPAASAPADAEYYLIHNLNYVYTDASDHVLATIFSIRLTGPDEITVYSFQSSRSYVLTRK